MRTIVYQDRAASVPNHRRWLAYAMTRYRNGAVEIVEDNRTGGWMRAVRHSFICEGYGPTREDAGADLRRRVAELNA